MVRETLASMLHVVQSREVESRKRKSASGSGRSGSCSRDEWPVVDIANGAFLSRLIMPALGMDLEDLPTSSLVFPKL